MIGKILQNRRFTLYETVMIIYEARGSSCEDQVVRRLRCEQYSVTNILTPSQSSFSLLKCIIIVQV